MTVLRGVIGEAWLRTHVIAVVVAVLLCLTGAAGTQVFGLPLRLGYWLILMTCGTAMAQLAGHLLDRLTSLNLWQEILVMMALIVPPITLMVWLLSAAFSDEAPSIARLPGFVLPVLIISLVMAVLHSQVNRVPAQSHAFRPAEKVSEPGAALRARLPFKLRQADIHALSGEDHYLRVHSSAGEALILMRLNDAIRELDGIEGSQVHRSWWVAREAITDVRRGDGRIALIIKGGAIAPVSRSYVKALKGDGWL